MDRQKLSTVVVSLWSRDQGEPGREGAAASSHDPPAVRSAGPAPDCALGAEEHGCDAPGEAAAADGAGPAAAGAGGPCSPGWAPSGTAGSVGGPAFQGGHRGERGAGLAGSGRGHRRVGRGPQEGAGLPTSGSASVLARGPGWRVLGGSERKQPAASWSLREGRALCKGRVNPEGWPAGWLLILSSYPACPSTGVEGRLWMGLQRLMGSGILGPNVHAPIASSFLLPDC